MQKIIPHRINGKNIIVEHQKLAIINPATGVQSAILYCADQDLVNSAVLAAQAAQLDWSSRPYLKKAIVLRNFAKIIEDNSAHLAQLVSQEHGKTREDAEASIQRGLELLHYHCAISQQLQGTYSQVALNVTTHTIYQPLGVCAGITPFNFPVMVPMWMMVPAIACGNAFILKPSEQVPSASLQLVEWFEEAGLPAGVAQCLQGKAQTVQLLLEHPDIKAITAVASTKVANHIYTEATKRGKRAHTFGGAKNHAVVMSDANLEYAADNIVRAAFGSAGQRCMAISVVIAVGQKVAAPLMDLLTKKINQINPKVDMGPVVSAQKRNFLVDCITQGEREGAKLLIDGRNYSSNGFFIGPSLFDNVTTAMSIYQNELFGPILSVMHVNNLEEAIELINNHRYGNGGVIFTQSGHLAQHFSNHIECGMVGINIAIPVPVVSHPFGGWKESSFGSNGMHGMESINFYTKRKSIVTSWPENNLDASFSMPHH